MTKGSRARSSTVAICCGGLSLLTCCATESGKHAARLRPNLAPATQPALAGVIALRRDEIQPMYTELLPIDLPTVIRVARADNLDIRQAQQAVVASRGQLESTVGSVFPAIVPSALFEHVEGAVRATPGNLVGVGFNSFQLSGVVQWVMNPGRVIYEIIAAKKRLLATEDQERAVVLETTRQAIIQFYDLVLAQTRVAAAQQAVAETEELLRISQLRVQTGTAVPANELQAKARHAERHQDLILALKAFYDASVALAVTLRLDVAVTLVPKVDELPPVTLVRDDLALGDLLAVAVEYRPDLAAIRKRVEAAAADRGATWWGDFGPQFQLAYQFGGITGHSSNTAEPQGIPGNLIVNPLSQNGSFSSNPVANGLIKEAISRGAKKPEGQHNQTFGFKSQQRAAAGASWHISLSAFGDLKSASAAEAAAQLDAERQLDHVRAQVVQFQQASRANAALIPLAQEQVTAAAEALRLAQANYQAGTMTTVDVLQAEQALAQARVRFADAVVHYNQAQVDLLSAVGLADEESLFPSSASTGEPLTNQNKE